MLSAPDYKMKQTIFIFLSKGEKLSFKNDNFVVHDADGKIKHQSTCYRLFALFLVGSVTITSGLLQRSEKFGFTIVLMTHNLRVYGVWRRPAPGNTLLRQKQYSYNGLEIAHILVKNKIHNQLSVLKSIRQKQPSSLQAIESIKQYQSSLNDQKMALQELLGVEGIVSRTYFQSLFADYSWTARRPRVKHDPINCLLDIGYTMLFNIIEALLDIYGFDLYQGVYHQQYYQRKSLVCDLVEPFRPLIDARIFKACRLNQIHHDDFYVHQNRYSLFGKSSRPYITWLLEALMVPKEAMFLFIQSYYRAFMKDKPSDQYPHFQL